MELFRENEELIRVNRWLEERLKKYEETIAALINVNSKDSIRSRLRL